MGESWVCRDGFGRDDGLDLRRSWVWSTGEGLGLRRVVRNWGEVGFDLLLGMFGCRRLGIGFLEKVWAGEREGGDRGLGLAVENVWKKEEKIEEKEGMG